MNKLEKFKRTTNGIEIPIDQDMNTSLHEVFASMLNKNYPGLKINNKSANEVKEILEYSKISFTRTINTNPKRGDILLLDLRRNGEIKDCERVVLV